MNKTGLILLSGTLICLLSLFLLVKLAGMPNESGNGFRRTWLNNPLIPVRQIPVQAPLEKIAGATSHHIFFSVPNPRWMVMLDPVQGTQDTISFPVPNPEQLAGAKTAVVDSPWFYLHANNVPAVFRAQFGGRLQAFRLPTSLFTRAAQVSPACVIVRAFDSSQQQQVFQRIDLVSGKVLSQAVLIPQEKKDNGFATDGLLQYDRESHRLVFVQFYQNRFWCFDTSLTLLYTGHTIDTSATNQVSIRKVHIGEEDRYMPSAPRVAVNELSCVHRSVLYVCSGLRADNEGGDNFRYHASIDGYDLRDGRYTGSFHIPLPAGEKLKSFLITDDRVIALFRGQVSLFRHRGL